MKYFKYKALKNEAFEVYQNNIFLGELVKRQKTWYYKFSVSGNSIVGERETKKQASFELVRLHRNYK